MTRDVGFLGKPSVKGPVRLPSIVGHLSARVREQAKKIKLLGLDVDGVMTDGRLFYHDDGTESKAFDVRDGHGIKMLQRSGVQIVLISGRNCPSVEKRAADLEIMHVNQGIRDKVSVLEQILSESHLTPEQAAFMGDDIVDLPVMRFAGFAVAVADASEFVISAAHYVTVSPGGRGAVREVAELILSVQGLWNEAAGLYFS